ncbi:hypothetical protein FA15DRAFT_693004 [Coprinopsis marcescibilis]|uniref:Uncharacterized protein n=1 Tax=Coprinopsis marcescibilis TaxID=230819 RepID=A0A5C3L1V5_COPMA|nr:hypothetical protein FA15DRAFT_693004 [Coprinopsis marcescibilis]
MDSPPRGTSSREDGQVSSNSLSYRGGRKRHREPSRDREPDGMDDQYDIGEDGRPKTRRVNPQRLALRLGPDLVAEMEALIVPGAKMPTFAVRKDFQERYCVDRRHIYDYFHSRGLRVAKEDKHTNLIRGRAMKAAAAAADSPATLPTSATPDAPPSSKTASDPGPEQNTAVMRTLSAPSLSTNSVKPKSLKPYGRLIKRKRLERIQSKKTFLAHPEQYNSRESSSSLSEAFDPPPFSSGFLQSSSQKSCFIPNRGEGSDSSSSMATQEDIPTPSFFVSPDDALTLSSLATSLGTGPLIFQEDNPGALLDPNVQLSEFMVPMDDHEISLTKQERADLYACVQQSIQSTPLSGEKAGTYDAYMKSMSYRSSGLNVGIPFARSTRDSPLDSSALNYTYGGDSTLDLFDLRSYLSEDFASEGDLSTYSQSS